MPNSMHCGKKLVLVADDDPLLVMLLEHHLMAAGYRVISAPDGETALSLIALESPDAIVLDQMMPVMSGADVLRDLKAEGQLGAARVLMLTTLKNEEYAVGALRLGASDFLTKPFNPSELVARIDKLVSPATR